MTIRIGERWQVPAVLAVAVFVFVVVDHTLVSDTDLGLRQSTGLALLQALAIVLQLRFAVLGWLVSAVAVGYASVAVGGPLWVEPMFNSYLVVMALLAVRVPWRTAAVVWTATTGAGAVLTVVMPHAQWTDVVGSAVLAGLVLVAAAAVRAVIDARRGAYEQARESARQRQRTVLLEERARIARELHDVVAHHMSVIAIQAESARYRIADPPPELLTSLSAIHAGASAALGEMRRILGVLHAEADEPTHPQPRIADIDGLVEGIHAAGRQVLLGREGSVRALATGVEVCAYRIVQEALSNAVRHAPGADIRIELRYRTAALEISVTNGPGGPGPPARSGGRGLIGMRERVAVLGGGLETVPTPEGGFSVRAVLPLPERNTP
ncbi:sensor histidine kinase [Nocardia brasiliensis]|uniref:sensor histidine kinase n=1 Tax=Nocardia brasiliensis TaxID=37326 RepID=UPI001895ABF8|nr:histidine kinase [Nocardia brasiliensis]MBF6541447.1 two-component sensor histidine kinase [Nocardia brasiliensis]